MASRLHLFWASPAGDAGMLPVTADNLEAAKRSIVRLHPGSRLDVVRGDEQDGAWMPSRMTDWVLAWGAED